MQSWCPFAHSSSGGQDRKAQEAPGRPHVSPDPRGHRALPGRSLHHCPRHLDPSHHLRTAPHFCSLCPWPTTCPAHGTSLTVSGTTETTFHAVATPILAPPGTPATVGSSQAQGTLGSLSTAQRAALWPPKQPPTASSHTSQGQVGRAQTLSRETKREKGGKKVKHLDCTLFSQAPPSLVLASSRHKRDYHKPLQPDIKTRIG